MSEWQPIETAPMDGAEIIGWREDCGCILVRYTCCADFLNESEAEKMDDEELFAYDWFYADFLQGGRLDYDLKPTHWMPLPEPPK